MQFKRNPHRFFVRVARIIFKELLHIDDSAHAVRTNHFADIAVIHFKGYRLAEIRIATDFVNHGFMRTDILPQALLCLTV